MNPMMLMALLSGAPGLLSSLGLMGQDPRQKLQQQLMQLLSPQNQTAMTNKFFQQGQNSPAYSQAQGSIAAGTNATSGQLANSLGARGIGTSGTGALLSSLAPSIAGGQQAQLNTGLYNAAQGQAQNTIQDQMRALMGTGGQPSMTQGMFGAGLGGFGDFLQKYLMQQKPNNTADLGSQTGGGALDMNSIARMLGQSFAQ